MGFYKKENKSGDKFQYINPVLLLELQQKI